MIQNIEFLIRLYIAGFKDILNIILKDTMQKRNLFIVVFIIFLNSIILILLPIFLKNIIDYLSDNKSFSSQFLLITISYISLLVFTGIFTPLRELLSLSISDIVTNRIKVNFVDKIFKKNIFEKKFISKPGAISNNLQRSEDAVTVLICDVFFLILPAIVEFCIATYVCYIYFPWNYPILLFSTIIWYTYITLKVTKRSLSVQNQENLIRDKCSNYLISLINNWEFIKLNNTSQQHKKEFIFLINSKEKSVKRTLISQVIYKSLESIISSGGQAVIIFMAIYDVINNVISLGDLTLIISYTTQIMQPFRYLGTVFYSVQKNYLGLKQILDFINKNNQKTSPIKSKKYSRSENLTLLKQIKFENVNFKYPVNNFLSLRSINFTVNPRDKIVILGINGSGKSTLCKLMLGHYKLKTGKIYYHKTDIKKIDTNELSNWISYFHQESHIFDDSILRNLTYFNKEMDQKYIEEICDSLGILDPILKLPNKFYTKVSKILSIFSGGELQKLSIARSIFKKSDIYIFDEPTTYLDHESKVKFINTIFKYLHDKTIIITSHDDDIINSFDKRIVMQNGEIIEIIKPLNPNISNSNER